MRRALLLAAILAAPAAALDVPALSGRVNDHAALLSPAASEALTKTLKDFETRTGHQIAVLTVSSLEGEPLEPYSLKVIRAWGLGRKGANDGVLFLIAKSDRKLRIEVGHGLEGSLPDALAGRIIQETVVPRFKAGDYEGGIAAGAAAIIAATDGTYVPPPVQRRKLDPFELAVKLFMSLFVFSILGRLELQGLVTPGYGWVIYFFLIPFWGTFPFTLWGSRIGTITLMTHLLGFPLLKLLLPSTAVGRKFSATKGGGVSFGDTVLFSGGSGGGGSSSGGGGFSGGGGSSGGGGASGSW
jgi:uncharacterized protein